MGIHLRNLAEGLISSSSSGSPTVLYPPAGSPVRGVLIKSIILFNLSTSTSAQVNIKIRPASAGGNDRYLAPVNLEITKGNTAELDFPVTMLIGPTTPDQIIAWVDAAHASQVSYVISGIEKDQ